MEHGSTTILVDEAWGNAVTGGMIIHDKISRFELQNSSKVPVTLITHSLPYVKLQMGRTCHANRQRSYINVGSANGNPRSKAAEVIATFINASENCELPNKRTEHSRLVHLSSSKDKSSEWGWFADIDSSNESNPGDVRHGYVSGSTSECHQLIGEIENCRVAAAHKTFCSTQTASGVVSASIALPKFRIVQSTSGADRHAEYLVAFKLGREFYADWRRHSEFTTIVKDLPSTQYKRSLDAWKNIDTRWFNRLEPDYLHKKCIALESFIREVMYESSDPAILVDFLGGEYGKVNARPEDEAYRPSAQLPKEMRPAQPPQEREMFEKLWAENFKRSSVAYDLGDISP